jgi:phospholipid/cholesterol/gamma-HCH transport system substrate-binding protein
LQGEQLGKDVSTVAGALGRILAEVEQGDGTVHRLIYDRSMAEEVDQVIAETRKSVTHVRSAVARVDAVLAEVQHGDGTLHEVVYGQEGKHALAELRTAASEIGAVIREVREGDGLLHTLVYGEGNTDFLLELNEFAAALNRMAKNMAKGRGTLGALAVDPTVYEDMKAVLGNVERHVLLKALIRFTIDNEALRRDPPKARPASQ